MEGPRHSPTFFERLLIERNEERADPAARANGLKRPWLILNVCQKMNTLALIISVLLLAGSAAPLNQRTSMHYAEAGAAAQQRNDWPSARMNWSRAVGNAEMAGAPPRVLATMYYEYGRSLGAVCEFGEAETYLQKALKIDQQTGGDFFLDLTELARLNFDQQKFSGAVVYFDQLVPALDAKHAEEGAPAALIDILSEYADCLRKLNREEEAKKADDRAASIRAKNSNLHSITERTPYGKYPEKKG